MIRFVRFGESAPLAQKGADFPVVLLVLFIEMAEGKPCLDIAEFFDRKNFSPVRFAVSAQVVHFFPVQRVRNRDVGG